MPIGKKQIADTIPELPDARRDCYKESYGLSDYDAGLLTVTPGDCAVF